MTKMRTRRASWTPSSSSCPAPCRTCLRSNAWAQRAWPPVGHRVLCGWWGEGLWKVLGGFLRGPFQATHCLSGSFCSFLLHNYGLLDFFLSFFLCLAATHMSPSGTLFYLPFSSILIHIIDKLVLLLLQKKN